MPAGTTVPRAHSVARVGCSSCSKGFCPAYQDRDTSRGQGGGAIIRYYYYLHLLLHSAFQNINIMISSCNRLIDNPVTLNPKLS